jgi:hypothetical protein
MDISRFLRLLIMRAEIAATRTRNPEAGSGVGVGTSVTVRIAGQGTVTPGGGKYTPGPEIGPLKIEAYEVRGSLQPKWTHSMSMNDSTPPMQPPGTNGGQGPSVVVTRKGTNVVLSEPVQVKMVLSMKF